MRLFLKNILKIYYLSVSLFIIIIIICSRHFAISLHSIHYVLWRFNGGLPFAKIYSPCNSKELCVSDLFVPAERASPVKLPNSHYNGLIWRQPASTLYLATNITQPLTTHYVSAEMNLRPRKHMNAKIVPIFFFIFLSSGTRANRRHVANRNERSVRTCKSATGGELTIKYLASWEDKSSSRRKRWSGQKRQGIPVGENFLHHMTLSSILSKVIPTELPEQPQWHRHIVRYYTCNERNLNFRLYCRSASSAAGDGSQSGTGPDSGVFTSVNQGLSQSDIEMLNRLKEAFDKQASQLHSYENELAQRLSDIQSVSLPAVPTVSL